MRFDTIAPLTLFNKIRIFDETYSSRMDFKINKPSTWFQKSATVAPTEEQIKAFLQSQFVGFGEVSGKGGNQAQLRDGYASNVDIYSIINKIAEPASSINWIVEKRNSEGAFEEVTDTTIHELMSNPNPVKGFTWHDYIYQSLIYLLASGDSFTWLKKPVGFAKVTEVDVLPSQYTCINTRENFVDPVVNYSLNFANSLKFERDEIMHSKKFNPYYTSINEMVYGLSPIQVAWLVVTVGTDRWKADASLLKNKGAIGILTNKTDTPFPAEHELELQKRLNSQIGGTNNFGKTAVTAKNLDFIQMAMSSTDLQLLEKDVITLRAACNVYGLPSELLNDPQNKTFNNRKEANKELWTNGIQPNLNILAEEFNRLIVPSHYPEGGYRMRPDYRNVEALQADQKELVSTWVSLKKEGIQTANQAAEALSDVGAVSNEEPNADKLIISTRSATLVENIDELNDSEINASAPTE